MTKRIEIDDDIYRHIASHTQHIGESASSILRRLLGLDQSGALPTGAEAEPPVAEKAHGRTIFDSMTSADLAGQRSVVARFLYILGMLHKCHPEMFPKVLQISGRDRQYFSRSAAELEASGTSTNPKQIPNSDFYVVTNNNTTRKKSMLNQVALELGYDQKQAEKIRDFL
ncbi:replication initiation regulator SeqA [Pseudidiomarina terrestris]|uniref:Negative modulator of initiation of replication n=1 Tax=Pseudidiomarina terrestris TaxID=2820060 RepID=A0AAW7QYH7_9GAMM|nr:MULTISPECIES: replication initiation regulator SeqA [unclassified Pseudidiomarina]MDN7124089.1 replication initiation regulator SeqA [Pseudidiomarina sp. 1APP75-32.1]MDN7127161.1 replication initiation regulator SeqA [Pseudidiomarina sp. 1APR75-33.1]MDN7128346.1 replication initiation regulator SeqA [Pseudidiomarina sp. 1APR75-15]MDN7135426.1 replication initiation regulator SeqA [Pseudidiomarina sp. 1ASP75-5]MDN7138542.1 replication initiation regulator SeqA [Pseudidiomarina sp. 1ASP75-14]